MTVRPPVILIVDHERDDLIETRQQMCDLIAPHTDRIIESSVGEGSLPADLPTDARAVVIGGDGTIIRQARLLADHAIPIIGINVGRLGFLAEFDVATFAEHAAVVLGPNPPVESRMLIEAAVHNGDPAARSVVRAVNDFVITAGPPFRMIELRLAFDGVVGPTFSGDGLIVATPIGSTAHNASAGGPIVHPGLDAMVLTPLAPHSLAFRPIMVRGDQVVSIEVVCCNPGTALVRDGHAAAELSVGDRIEIRRSSAIARIVTNPNATYWRIVQEKLRWAAPPRYREPES